MSLKDKSNIVIKYYSVNDFINWVNRYNYSILKFDKTTCSLFGVSFKNLWRECDLIEKIELIFLLRLSDLWGIFKSEHITNFIMQTEHYIEAQGKKIIISEDKKHTKQWVVIVDKTDAHVLKEINDPEINEYYYNFTHAKNIKEQQDVVCGMWNHHFVNSRKNMEIYPQENFNFDSLGRRVNTFTRHPEEKQDKSLRKKWDSWDDFRKKQELLELFWKMLIWKILNKKNNGE